MAKIIRRLKAEALWVDPEDKKRFIRIMFGRIAETQKQQTQESTFKFIIDEFFRQRGDENANIGNGKSG